MFEHQTHSFEKALNGAFHQSFQKIRGRNRKQENSEVGDLFEERKRLKKELKHPKNILATSKLEQIEKK